jgi:hypothetical protein
MTLYRYNLCDLFLKLLTIIKIIDNENNDHPEYPVSFMVSISIIYFTDIYLVYYCVLVFQIFCFVEGLGVKGILNI